MKYIQDHKKKIIEGELRCDELSKYLHKINAPIIVWLSEDATGIVQRVVYDVSTNQMIGIVLPFNQNGMPVTFSYKAQSIGDIERCMKKPKSYLAYVIMAQPIQPNSPPFLLQIYGTDNKFSSANVLNRWDHTKTELKKFVHKI